MYKNTYILFLVFFSMIVTAQKSSEQFPIFPKCENQKGEALEECFTNEVQTFVYNNFKIPQNLSSDYKGTIVVLFEVNESGNFKVQFVDSNEETLITESKRVFGQFPKITPPTYNGKPTYSKYTIKIAIPLQNPADAKKEEEKPDTESKFITDKTDKNRELTEFDKVVVNKFENPQFSSHLNIAFSHSYYSQFDAAINQVGSNNHTASKPFTYAEVGKYYDFNTENSKLMKKTTSWTRKIWNESTVAIQGDGYWFTINPIFDLQLGKSDPSVAKYTYVNTRGLQLRGGLGKQINFTTTVYESQGRFADYYNNFAQSIKPSGGNPAIIPGIGIAKEFKTDSYDFPLAEANLTFAPSNSLISNWVTDAILLEMDIVRYCLAMAQVRIRI